MAERSVGAVAADGAARQRMRGDKEGVGGRQGHRPEGVDVRRESVPRGGW